MRFPLWLLFGLLLSTHGYANNFQLAERPDFRTWWHFNSDWNQTSPVPLDRVRRSAHYHVRVAPAEDALNLYDSFVYASIPRNGMSADPMGRLDGAEFAAAAGLSMNWSSFIYSHDVYVYVTRFNQKNLSLDQVKIRPASLGLETAVVDGSTIRIKVPFRAQGLRFSVEFADDLLTSYVRDDGLLNTSEGRSIHEEPRHALLVFANPADLAQAADLVPDLNKPDVWTVPEGAIDLKKMEGYRVLAFQPGTYYLPPQSHAYLPSSVEWIYLAPGSYVKAAFEFRGDRSHYKVTGHGVLSGEMYMYEPDRANGYQRTTSANCHGECVKMLQFFSTDAQQKLLLDGVTVANPPYHSFVVYGNSQTFDMKVRNFKQVGAFYWQTDGIELYDGGRMEHSFIHSNDDVIKLYHSRLSIEDIVVWKGENGPVIQFGWTPRSFDSVTVKNIAIIHNRMYWPNITHNHCIINSALDYRDTASLKYGDPKHTIRNVFLEGIHAEGQNLCAMRLYALSNWETIHIKDLFIDAWNELAPSAQQSQFKRLQNRSGQDVEIGNESTQSQGLKIENYRVGGQRISKWDASWRADQLGRLNFDSELWDNWNAW